MISELFLEGYRVDVSADISSLLTFAIDDIKDFAARSTTFSKTVVLPGTNRNNDLLGNIFDLGSANEYSPSDINLGYNFNAAKSAKCTLFQDNLQTFKGTMRLLQINVDRGRVEYEVALNGDLTTLNVALSSGLLTDLDFSEYNHEYNVENIVKSWPRQGSSYSYPLIDYGNYSTNKHDWDYKTFRPALFVKEYIDKMFAAAGFRYQSNVLNSERVRRLIIPHNQKVLTSRVSNVLTGSIRSSQEILNTTHGQSGATAGWAALGGGFTQNLGVFTYTQSTALVTTISWKITGVKYSDTLGSFKILVRKNGVAIADSGPISTFPHNSFYSFSSAVRASIANNDTLDFYWQYLTGTGVVVTIDNSAPGYSGFTVVSDTPTLQPITYGQRVTMNDCIPQNIRQIDFLSSIVKLHNLYVTEDQFDDRLIKITPFIDFYQPSVLKPVDWTYKLDRSQVVTIKPMSELNSKLYSFNYAGDSDYYNDLYQKRYNQGYGSFIYDTEFEFADQTNSLTLVFASTPLVGYDGEEKVYSTIFKRTGDVVGKGEEQVDSVIRLLSIKQRAGINPWRITLTTPGPGDAPPTTGTLGTYKQYLYAGHFSDPDFPAYDYNFGATKELFFALGSGALNRGQFNVYWSGYMAEITDKDSKLLTGKFYLTPKDIFDLDFSRFVYVDGVLFRINKIVDYNASDPSSCEVQLLKVIRDSYTLVNVPPIAEDPDNYLETIMDGDPVVDYDGQRVKYKLI